MRVLGTAYGVVFVLGVGIGLAQANHPECAGVSFVLQVPEQITEGPTNTEFGRGQASTNDALSAINKMDVPEVPDPAPEDPDPTGFDKQKIAEEFSWRLTAAQGCNYNLVYQMHTLLGGGVNSVCRSDPQAGDGPPSSDGDWTKVVVCGFIKNGTGGWIAHSESATSSVDGVDNPGPFAFNLPSTAQARSCVGDGTIISCICKATVEWNETRSQAYSYGRLEYGTPVLTMVASECE